MQTMLCLLLTLIAADPGTQDQARFGPRMLLSQRAIAIQFDGRLDEPQWQSADAVTDFSVPVGAKLLDTEVRALHDEQTIYLGVRCAVPSRASIITDYDEGGNVFRDDSIEVFFDPGRGGRETWQFGVNAAGKVTVLNMAERKMMPRGDFVDAKAGWDEAGSSYTLELAIPRQRYGLEPPLLHAVGIAFLRNQEVSHGGRRVYRFCWKTDDPKLWGNLFLLDEDSLVALRQQWKQQLENAAEKATDPAVGGMAKALLADLPMLAADKATLVAFESRLLGVLQNADRQYWRQRFEALFKIPESKP